MNQHEWVYGCYAYYLENYIEPGNPEDGVWEDCHYPTPKCLGGTETVKLLKEHHAVHGVLQSEEFARCCVYGWEKPYLTNPLLKLWQTWMAHKGNIGLSYVTSEMRQELARRLNDMPPEQRSERMRQINARRTPKIRADAAAAARAARTREGQAKAGRAGAAKLHAQRWRCTVTGFVTTPGPLTTWQRARGIDPSNRERLVD